MKKKGGKTRPRSGRRILFLVDFSYASARAIAAGVLQFVSAHPELELVVRGGHPDSKDCEYAEERGIDGIVTCLSTWSEELHRVLAANPDCPVAYASVARGQMAPEARRAAAVLCDNAAVANAAADLLIRHGLSSFGYLGTRLESSEPSWDRERREAFAAALARRGFGVRVYFSPPQPSAAGADMAALARWLRALPKPCGLFVSYDMRAMDVLGLCRAIDIAVPEQLHVVGADNEEWICEHTSPTLTSIEPDFEECGRCAAETLLAMMDGEPCDAERTFGVRRVEQRMSTIDMHGSANRAVRARKVLRGQFSQKSVSSESIAVQLGCSRRLLQLAYKAVFRRTIQEDLAEMRLERAKKLLDAGDVPVCDIPERVGFSSPDYLMRLFKKRTGMTMLQWRRARRGR